MCIVYPFKGLNLWLRLIDELSHEILSRPACSYRYRDLNIHVKISIMSTNTNFVDVTIYMPMPLRSAPSFFVGTLLNRKFHTSQISNCEEFVPITAHNTKKWYLYVTYSVPISHFVKNTHVGKCHRAYIRIPLIYKIAPPPPSQAATFCIRFQFFTVLSPTYLLTYICKSQFSHQTNLMY